MGSQIRIHLRVTRKSSLRRARAIRTCGSCLAPGTRKPLERRRKNSDTECSTGCPITPDSYFFSLPSLRCRGPMARKCPHPDRHQPQHRNGGGIPSRGLLSFCTWRICSSLPPKSFIRWAANALSDADREWYVANETFLRNSVKSMPQRHCRISGRQDAAHPPVARLRSRETDGVVRIPLREAEVWSGFPRSQLVERDRLRFHARRVSVRLCPLAPVDPVCYAFEISRLQFLKLARSKLHQHLLCD